MVTDRHVYYLTLQFYHDGEPMGSRNIRFDAIAEEQADGWMLLRAASDDLGNRVAARSYDPRSPTSYWRGWRRTNQQLIRSRPIIDN